MQHSQSDIEHRAHEFAEQHQLVLLKSLGFGVDGIVFDWMIRKKITNHLNFFFVYQMPVPRLSSPTPVKLAAQNAYRDAEQGLIR